MKRRITASVGNSITVPIKQGGLTARHSAHVLAIIKTAKGVEISNDRQHLTRSKQIPNLENNLVSKAIVTHLLTEQKHHQFTPATPEKIILPEEESGDAVEIAVHNAVHDFEKTLTARIGTVPTQSFPKQHRQFTKTKTYKQSAPAHHAVIWRAVAVFGVLGLLVTTPLYGAKLFANAAFLQSEISRKAKEVFGDVKGGGDAIASGDSFAAGLAFNDASRKLDESYALITTFKSQTELLTAALPTLGSKVTSAQGLSKAASESTKAVSLALAAFDQKKFDNTALPAIEQTLKSALPHIQAAKTAMASVTVTDLPPELQEKVQLFKTEINNLEPTLTTLTSMLGTWNALMAQKPVQRIVLVFQNNNEMRATGGFWGSFAYVTLKNGAIDSIEVPGGGTYDLQGSLDRLVRPPTPLTLVKNRWEFQDANWFPDFRDSAKQAVWFLEHSGYPTPDAVVAITPDVLKSLLTITGPIEIKDFAKQVDANNVTDVLQKNVEIEYNKKENQPKKIIGSLATTLLDKLTTLKGEQQLKALESLYRSLNYRDIMMFHQNEDAAKTIHDAGWDGAVADWDNDYLMVVNSNVAGQKTDGVITQSIDKKTVIDAKGVLTTTLTINRTHTGKKGDLFNGVRNVDFMRVYVPEHSVLLQAKGFVYPDESLFKATLTSSTTANLASIEAGTSIEPTTGTTVSTERGKTVFGNWVMTDPGQTSTVTLTYRTPSLMTTAQSGTISNTGRYLLMTQAQVGSKNTTFKHTLSIPRNWTVLANTVEGGKFQETVPLTTDHVSGVVVKME